MTKKDKIPITDHESVINLMNCEDRKLIYEYIGHTSTNLKTNAHENNAKPNTKTNTALSLHHIQTKQHQFLKCTTLHRNKNNQKI